MFDFTIRQPEHLVLHGYRCWNRAATLGSPEPWRNAERLYLQALGDRNATVALDALAEFASTAGLCARCPLRMLTPGAKALCRDEALVLGLVSSLQNGEDATGAFCAEGLAGPVMAGHVGSAAAGYSALLRACGQQLLPIPIDALRAICATSYAHGRAGPTLH
jgi:hypothetical protein